MNEHYTSRYCDFTHDSSNFIDSNNKTEPYRSCQIVRQSSQHNTTKSCQLSSRNIGENWRAKKRRTKFYTEHGWSLKINNTEFCCCCFFLLYLSLYFRSDWIQKERKKQPEKLFQREKKWTLALILLNCVCVRWFRIKFVYEPEKQNQKWRSMAFAALCSASKCSRLGKSLINNFVGASSTAPTYLRYKSSYCPKYSNSFSVAYYFHLLSSSSYW